MKYILLPIHPEWCCKLMNGDKETEVRRGTAIYNAIDRLIKEQGKAPCLIYCTKSRKGEIIARKGEDLSEQPLYLSPFVKSLEKYLNLISLNGKVVAQFEAQPDRIFNVRFGADEDECAREHRYVSSMNGCDELEKDSCLEYGQLLKYLGKEWDDGYIGTAIHVKPGTMRTDGFPKDLSNYGVRKAPQSFMYIDID